MTVNKKEGRRYSIYDELRTILVEMWQKGHSLIPSRFLKAFYESIGDLYTPGEQLDLTEMWMLLLANLIEETHVVEKDFLGMVETGDNATMTYLQHKARESWKRFFHKDSNSPLNQLLHGVAIQQIECGDCKRLYHNMEPISFSYLEIEGDHLGKCFQKLLQPEKVEGWKCDVCQKETVGERVLRFWKLPVVWVIFLKRFTQDSKINTPLHLTKEFSVHHGIELCGCGPGTVGDVGTGKEVITYELKAVANHLGVLQGGHYHAVCKNEDGSWNLYDDLAVTPVNNIDEYLQSNRVGYALFYERKES